MLGEKRLGAGEGEEAALDAAACLSPSWSGKTRRQQLIRPSREGLGFFLSPPPPVGSFLVFDTTVG